MGFEIRDRKKKNDINISTIHELSSEMHLTVSSTVLKFPGI